MITGCNFIGFEESVAGNKKIRVFSTVKRDFLPEDFACATDKEIDTAIKKASVAFNELKKIPGKQRALFLEAIASEIIDLGPELIERAMLESGLTEARLTGERGRTVNQLKLFATLLREGSWVEAVIDTAIPERTPLPRADLRKISVPIGPVVVFGASNFPFAFSTAGGDTASALAAGCPVIVKAHPSHLGTNELVSRAIIVAARKCGMPDGIFSSLTGEGAGIGQNLVKHAGIKAVGFTGSLKAGMALYRAATSERADPIPVYAEMSSINPVLILPEKLEEDVDKLVTMLAGSIILGVGQFCTNPGLIFLIDNEAATIFTEKLSAALKEAQQAVMLNEVVARNYYAGLEQLSNATAVETLVAGKNLSTIYKADAALLKVAAPGFIASAELQQEIFGPSSMIILCKGREELLQAITTLHGQLTGTVIGTAEDVAAYMDCVEILTDKVGRLLFNDVPTGVEVTYAMVHGGPFPATTDARSTSVGTDAIKRFVRPVCFQNCPEELLPEALRNDNPNGITRRVNGVYTNNGV